MADFFTTEISDPQYESDGLRWITVKSNALKRRADITLYIPEHTPADLPLSVVILLHGVYGSSWAWSLKGGVHKTAQKLIENGRIKPVVLAMPSDGLYGDGSGYLPHQQEDYEKWIAVEVMAVVCEQIKGVTDQSALFIAGLSMGGYGALRLGAKYPEVFRSFSGLSSITEFSQLSQFLTDQDYFRLKNEVIQQESALECLLANKNRLPDFRFECGMEDDLIIANRKLHQSLQENNIAHRYFEYPGGHEWDYWKAHIEESLLFFDSCS